MRITGPESSISCPHLSVEPDGEDVVGVAVVTDLCALLEVVDVHPAGHGQTDHHHQAAGEQPLHDVHVWTLYWERDERETLDMDCISHLWSVKANTQSYVVNSYITSSMFFTNDCGSTSLMLRYQQKGHFTLKIHTKYKCLIKPCRDKY